MSERLSDILKIKPLKTNKNEIVERELMVQHYIPNAMTSTIIVGKSGSGKTCTLINLLSNPHMYGGTKPYFDDCVIFSKTASKEENCADDAYQGVEWLKKENFINDFDIEQIDAIFELQKAEIEEKGYVKAQTVLLIFDDCLSEPSFLRSKQFRRLFVESRHYKLTCIINTQSLNAIERTARLNANNIIFFPSSMAEVTALCDSFCPSFLTNKEFINLIEYATNTPYSFLYINMKAPPGQQYRKNFTEILDVNSFRKKR
jgi:hypothetical protein